MDDSDVTTVRLSEKAKKRYFFNAVDDTDKIFKGIQDLQVPIVKEIQPQAVPVDPFAYLEERNRELDAIRKEAAMKSDAVQTLIKEPVKKANTVETVSVDELPTLVRQIAENRIVHNLKQGMSLKRK